MFATCGLGFVRNRRNQPWRTASDVGGNQDGLMFLNPREESVSKRSDCLLHAVYKSSKMMPES